MIVTLYRVKAYSYVSNSYPTPLIKFLSLTAKLQTGTFIYVGVLRHSSWPKIIARFVGVGTYEGLTDPGSQFRDNLQRFEISVFCTNGAVRHSFCTRNICMTGYFKFQDFLTGIPGKLKVKWFISRSELTNV
jgi:hypothetical protein